MKPLYVPAVALLLLAAWPRDARADCRIDTAPLIFPAYDVYASTPADAVGTIRFKCVRERPDAASLRIHLDTAADGTFERRMRSGAEALRYNVFLDPAREIVWGDGTRDTRPHVRRCCQTSSFQTVNLYGRIFPGQDVAGGTYEDSVLVAIEF